MKNSLTLNLNVPWGHIAVKTWGNIKNTGVLMVHGTLDNAGTFDRLITLLPENFSYVSIDLPGHGFSSHFENGTRLDFFTYVLVIKFVLDKLYWDNAIYIGHSLGAQLGLFFSIIYPERIKKLILIDSVLPELLPNDQIISKIRKQYKLISEKSMLNNLQHYTKEQVIFGLKYLRRNCLTTEAAKALFERSITKIGENSYIYNRDIRAKSFITPLFKLDQYFQMLKEVKNQILLIFVTDSIVFEVNPFPSILDFFKNYNNISIVKVKGNHDVHNNYPERISELISRFIEHFPSKL